MFLSVYFRSPILSSFIRYFLCCALCVITLISHAALANTASEIFQRQRLQVYQLQVIDRASGDTFSFGSGFQISADGHVATNFHVIASYLHQPEKYRMQLLKQDESTVDLKLLDIDVVHDLAIVFSPELGREYMQLSRDKLANGDRLYSMGNPHNLGMTIIEGTYNGYVKHLRHQRILFSGSLNPGMSGGPAFNAKGEVIGINVAKGSEQISFLVPVNNLINLVNRGYLQPSTVAEHQPNEEQDAKSDEDSLEIKEHHQLEQLQQQLAQSLWQDQQAFYQKIFSNDVAKDTLGEFSVPSQLAASLNCWGHSWDGSQRRYTAVHQHCRSDDRIFIRQNMNVGGFFYDMEWMASAELNPWQFYKAVEQRFEHPLIERQSHEQLTPLVCHSQRLSINQSQWKASSCLRRYVDYADFYDASLILASVDHNDKALVVKVGALGISQANARALMQLFMEQLKWNN